MILAAVGMKIVVSQMLPPVSYVILLEEYIDRTFISLIIATMAHAVCGLPWHEFSDGFGIDVIDKIIWGDVDSRMDCVRETCAATGG